MEATEAARRGLRSRRFAADVTFVPPVLAPMMANAADVRIDSADAPSSKQESSVQADAKDKDVIRDETKEHGVKSGDTESPLEEIVVTGTYIRGVAPASPAITPFKILQISITQTAQIFVGSDRIRPSF
jgi:hypothetical protein